MADYEGWYTPYWNVFKALDDDGKDIDLAMMELHTDGQRMVVQFRDKAGKAYQNEARNDVAKCVIRKRFTVATRPGYEKQEGRHIELADKTRGVLSSAEPMGLQDFEEEDFTTETFYTGPAESRGDNDAWADLDFRPRWIVRLSEWLWKN